MPYFNDLGWYTSQVIPDRYTDVEPENTSETVTPGELRANWSGVKWNIVPYMEPYPPSNTVNGVPVSVTRRQAKQALALAGLLTNVETVLNNIQDPVQKQLAQIEWNDSLNFERDRPLLKNLATALGLSDYELDQLFITASKL